MVPKGREAMFCWKQTAPLREGHPHPVGGKWGWSRRCHKDKIHLFGFAQRPLGGRGLELGYVFSISLLFLKSLYIE